MDIKKIRTLTKLMQENDLVEVEIESDGEKIKLSKNHAGMAPVPVVSAAPAVAAPAPVAAAAEVASVPAAAEDFSGCKEVTSPIPGTVYLKPNPESEVFVKVGDQISEGQVVCLVEAMKVFNEIKSEVSGVVKKIAVDDAQAVEYGTVLLYVE